MKNSTKIVCRRPARLKRRWASPTLAAVGLCGLVAAAHGDPVQFTSVLDDSPLVIKPLPHETITGAVKTFFETGKDPYIGNADAVASGKDVYNEWCQSCHLPDGSGRIGPSLIGDTHHYARFTTDKGMFEIVYGGATGAMQPFGNRLSKDQILRVMAYVRSLRK